MSPHYRRTDAAIRQARGKSDAAVSKGCGGSAMVRATRHGQQRWLRLTIMIGDLPGHTGI
jgi:hypothetical protein